MMNKARLFNQPRSQLALLYAIVTGSILGLLGYGAHLALLQSSNRMIDRELYLLSNSLSEQTKPILAEAGKLKPNAPAIIPEICLPKRACQPPQSNSSLQQLTERGYYLQLLNQQGQTIAAIGSSPDYLPNNPQLLPDQTKPNRSGESYHFHLMPLKNSAGELWGYIQVGQSVAEFDDYMNTLHLIIIFGIPLAMLLIGGASWWLAGMAMQPIYKSYAQMQQFTADAAHELRTPIASMQATIESTLTTSPHNPQETTQTLNILHRQNHRLKQLTQDLLLLTRLDNANAPMTPETICINEVLEDLEEELAPLAIAAHITLQCKLHTQHQNLYIKGNTGQIYRLVSNLITNAINYTPENGKVTVSLIPNQTEAIVQIQDTGIGIPESELPHLYDRFYRVSRDRGRKTGGSGLGLAIAQTIAQKHKGKITATSTVGQGSTFRIHLPLA